MPMKNILAIAFAIALQLAFRFEAAAQHNIQISIEEAFEQYEANSNTIAVAGKGVEIAKEEKARLNSTWYPYITALGSYINMSEKIEVKESIKELAQPVIDVFPELEQILSIIGPSSLSFPLLDNNIASIDGTIAWPLFTGGKRIYANKIGKSLVNTASLQKELVQNTQYILLIERYYTVKLLKRTVSVCRDETQANKMLYENAQKLMENGIINRAEMLVAKVAYEESSLKLETALREYDVAGNALLSMLDRDSQLTENSNLDLTTPFFICTSIPPLEHFIKTAMANNQQTNIIEQQKSMTTNSKKIAKSGYMPDISIFARQNFYSYNIPSNLLPRRMVGAALSWNIFDGFNREKRIKIARLQEESLTLGKEEAEMEITRAIRQLYSLMEDARESVNTIGTSMALTEDLLNNRQKSYIEGMATTQEVVDANALRSKSNLALTIACYQYEIALTNLLALCGNTSDFILYSNIESNIYN